MRSFAAYVFLLTFFTGFVPAEVCAQHPYFYSINDETGLPSNEVYCVIQDSSGFMWIGCETGLYRYDGFSFKAFRNSNQNGRAVSSLKLDSEGNLWCQNFAGQIYQVKGDSLTIRVDVHDQMKNHPSFDVDENGIVYLGTPGGILRVTGEKTEELYFPADLYVSEIKCLGQNKLLISTRDRFFYILDATTQSVIGKYTPQTGPDVCWMDKRSPLSLLIYSNNDTRKTEVAPASADFNQPFNLGIDQWTTEYFYTAYYQDSASVWITGTNGARLIELNTGRVLKHLFPGEKISNLFTDREGQYWFTSLDNGIYVVPSLPLNILDKTFQGLTDQNITSLFLTDSGSLLIGTLSGELFEYNPGSGNFRTLPKLSENRYRAVSSIIYNGDEYIVSRGNISFFNRDLTAEDAHLSEYLRDMQIASGKLYFASSIGTGYFNKLLPGHNWIDTLPVMLSDQPGRYLEWDKKENRIWAGQTAGLSYQLGDSLILFEDRGKPVYATALSYADSVLWVGTMSEGVLGITDLSVKYRFHSGNFLRGNSVTSVYAGFELLIVSTEICVNVIDLCRQEVLYLDITDGVNTKDVNVVTADSVNIYLGSAKGIFIVPRSTLHPNGIRPILKIKSVFVDNDAVDFSEVIEVDYAGSLRIEFESASVRARGTNRFRYRLNRESDWVYLKGDARELEFSSLSSGEFELEIEAINEDGFYSLKPVLLQVRVRSPFWSTWWFYTLIALLMAGIVAVVYSARIRYIRRQSLMKERLIRSQLKTLKAQMNPHFIFNSLNSIQELILQKDSRNSYEYLNKFSQLMRQVLEASDSEVISLADELRFLELYLDLEKLRFGDDFTFNLVVSSSLDPHYLSMPSMLLQPFVENAVKHGLLHKKGAKQLTVSVEPFEHGFRCRIEDNGIGRKKSEEINRRRNEGHRSFAVKAAGQRVELMNARTDFRINLIYEDVFPLEEDTGTRVVITIYPNQHDL